MEPAGAGQVDQRAGRRDGNYLPHLLPVDPTLHWANPPGGVAGRDTRPTFTTTPGPYTGPVPIVTHVHGAVGVGDESDGYAEAWYLPAASNIPAGYATDGTWYDFFKRQGSRAVRRDWGPGFATFQYPNANRASTIWYHDHTLGMTRLNVYAGPAGFYLIRGGPMATMPSRHPLGTQRSCPARRRRRTTSSRRTRPTTRSRSRSRIARSTMTGRSSTRTREPSSMSFAGPTSRTATFSPIWNPEFFGNTIIVNGNTWPFQTSSSGAIGFRFLNGCQSRFLILDFNDIPGVEVWQIGNEGGFLAAPVNLTANNGNRLLMGLAERADLIVDFTTSRRADMSLAQRRPRRAVRRRRPGRTSIRRPLTTGQVMEFRSCRRGADPTTPPQFLVLPAITPLPAASSDPTAGADRAGDGLTRADGPVEALLGTLTATACRRHHIVRLGRRVTENPSLGRHRDSGSSTTSPPTPTPCTSTRWRSRS